MNRLGKCSSNARHAVCQYLHAASYGSQCYGSGVTCHVADESRLAQGAAEQGETEPAAQSNSSKKKEKQKGYYKKKKQYYRGRGGRGGHQQSNEQH